MKSASHHAMGHLLYEALTERGILLDRELFVRWMQFGAFSAIMRTHSMKSAAMNKEPWAFSQEYFDVLRQTILMRYKVAPYVYTMARKTYDDGISLCRPMYYDYPDAQEAYSFKGQYMFGDDMLVAPVTSPMKEGYATVKVWLPEGTGIQSSPPPAGRRRRRLPALAQRSRTWFVFVFF